MQIKFTLSTKHQAREIFFRMFEEEQDRSIQYSREPTKEIAEGVATEKPEKVTGLSNGHLTNGTLTPPPTPKPISNFTYLTRSTEPEEPVSSVELRDMAEQFAELIPEDTFSPAEIQSFLIIRKKRPRQALREIEQWRDDLIKVKQEGGKVLDVQ